MKRNYSIQVEGLVATILTLALIGIGIYTVVRWVI